MAASWAKKRFGQILVNLLAIGSPAHWPNRILIERTSDSDTRAAQGPMTVNGVSRLAPLLEIEPIETRLVVVRQMCLNKILRSEAGA